MPDYYRHSGRVPLRGLLLSTGVGVVVGSVSSSVYAVVAHYFFIPVIKAIFPIGLGCFLGWIHAWALRKGGVRNPILAAVMGSFYALVALYVAWGVSFICKAGFRVDENGSYLYAFSPVNLWTHIQSMYVNGFWMFKGNFPLNGWKVATCWLAEGFFVVVATTHQSYFTTRDMVYCERCDNWCKTRVSAVHYSLNGVNQLAEQIQEGALDSLTRLATTRTETEDYLQIRLTYCPTCNQDNYLDLRRQRLHVRPSGKVSLRPAIEIVEKLVVRPEDLEMVKSVMRGEGGTTDRTDRHR